MIIFILDLDWMFDKSEIPNVNCMRISSFHKQLGHQVFLVNDMSELLMKYDKLYIWGESDSTPTVGHKILNDSRTTVFGKRFEFCNAKHIGKTIASCRPDYLLYDIQDNNKSSYAKANFITFYTDGGERIEKRQEWHNTKKGIKRTIITDDKLWSRQPEEIVRCLEDIVDEKNIVFLQPISLKCLVENESVSWSFCKLHFSRGTEFKWRNDVGFDLTSAQKIIKFLQQLKTFTRSKIGAVPFKLSMKNYEQDLKIFLPIAVLFKQSKFKCSLPLINSESSLRYIWLKNWIEQNETISFIEYFVFFKSARQGKRWFEIINDKQTWSDSKIKHLIQLLTRKDMQQLLPQMSIQWGISSIDYSVIDLQQIEYYGTMII